jgi:NAD/NADP transhydrogenase beta subunit
VGGVRNSHGYAAVAGYVTVTSLFAAIVGSVSFWGSLIAFGKLQEVLPGRPVSLGRGQQPFNLALFLASVACAVVIGLGHGSQLLIIGVLVAAAALGVMVVLPIGGADMPVVISLPIYGMPILNVDHAKSVIVLKRSMNPGFAGIENELYYDPKTSMLFGDAKSSVAEITEELKAL